VLYLGPDNIEIKKVAIAAFFFGILVLPVFSWAIIAGARIM
jgi:hypothetical protein